MSGPSIMRVIVVAFKVYLAISALTVGAVLGIWLMGPDHSNWLPPIGAATLIAALLVLSWVVRRRVVTRRWRRARPALAEEWWAFRAHCQEMGARPVFVWRVDRAQNGDLAVVAPIEVDGLTLADAFFPGGRVAAGYWYATVSNVSWDRGLRSESYLWVSGVTCNSVSDFARQAAAELEQEALVGAEFHALNA